MNNVPNHIFKGRVHLIEGEIFWANRGRSLFRSPDSGNTWQNEIKLPLSVQLQCWALTRIGRRMSRMDINHIVRIDSEHLAIVGFGQVFFFDTTSHSIVANYALMGKRPLVVCTHDRQLIYGEYVGNRARNPIRLVAVDRYAGSRVLHTFDHIRHIHGVCVDPTDDSLWVTTGDEDKECAIWRMASPDSQPEAVFSGSQQYRTVQLLFDQDHIYFGTDTPLEQNHIYRFERNLCKVECLHPVFNSVFYGCTVGDTHVFSTVCEPSNVNNQSMVTLVSASKCSVHHWTELIRLPKDLWPMKLFQYGQILFPKGTNPSSDLYFTPMGVRGDQNTYRIRMTNHGDVPVES